MLTHLILFSQYCRDHYYLVFSFVLLVLFVLETKFFIIQKTIRLIKNCAQNRISFPLCLLAALGLLIFIAFIVYQKYQSSSDELDYFFQAQTYLKGRLWNPPPLSHAFKFASLVLTDDKWFSRYPPGWPMALALGMFFHLPSWSINPILGTVSLYVLYLFGKLLYGQNIALMAIVFIICSPFFLFNAASFYAHTSCGLFIVLFVYCCYKFILKKDVPCEILCWAGFWWGWAFSVRYFTAALVMVPVFIEMIIKRKKTFWINDLWYFVLGALPFILMNLLYNYCTTGNALLTPFQFYDIHDRPHIDLRLDIKLMNILWNQQFWMSSSFFIVYFFLMIRHIKSRQFYWMEFIFLILVIFYQVFYPLRLEGAGNRYLYEGYFFCVLAVLHFISKWAISVQTSLFKKFIVTVMIAGFMMNIILLPGLASYFYHWISKDRVLDRLVLDNHLTHAIVLIPSFNQTKEFYLFLPNDPDLRNDVLSAYDWNVNKLMKAYPDRKFYRYFPHQGTFQKIN